MAGSFWETACQPNPGRSRPHSLGQMVQTGLFQVGGMICNDVARLHSLAYSCGNHGKSNQRACRPRLGARPARSSATDTLRVCQVQ